MASTGTVCGLGCMAGPPLGGLLYDYLASSPEMKFRVPFLVFGAVPSLLLPLAYQCMPDKISDQDDIDIDIDIDRESESESSESNPETTASLWSVMSPSLVLTTLAIALSGSIVATLDPTLGNTTAFH